MWNKDKLEQALERHLNIDCFDQAKIDFDSRRINVGDIFIALPGDNRDGMEYALRAYNLGASCVIVSGRVEGIPNDRQVIVADTYQCLLSLAKHKRRQYNGNIIAITGSLGKTTTKDFCHYIFSKKYKAYASYGNFNNHIGLPLCLANLDLDTEYAFFELGMNHLGEIRLLTKILEPNYAIITTITNAHIGNFIGISGIIKAKAEIAEGLRQGGKLILNAHGGYFRELYDHLTLKQKFPSSRIVAISAIEDEVVYADYPGVEFLMSLISCEHFKDFKVSINFRNSSEEKQIIAPVFKSTIALTFLFPFLLLDIFGESYGELLKEVERYQITNGRGLVKQVEYCGKKLWLVDESYNSSPDAVRGLLRDIGYYHKKYGYQIVFFMGGMLELGSDSEILHLSLAHDVVKAGIAKFIAIGTDVLPLYQELIQSVGQSSYHQNTSDCLHKIDKYVEDGDVVIVKGSRGIKTDLIVKTIEGRKYDA